MTIPVWVLLGFAAWTLLVLAMTIGTYRWKNILTGRVHFSEYGEYKIEGAGWYKRAMRAHANCVENLPVYAAIVVVLTAAEIASPVLDVFALILLGARVLHTSVHVAFEQTNLVVGMRSALFHTQWLCMAAMIAVIATRAV